MYETIAHCRFVDITRFWVVDLERFVRAVAIRFILQFSMEREDVVNQAILEVLHVCFLALATNELLPCGEQIFDRYDSLVGMSKNNSMNSTPPARFCLFWITSNKLICCGMSTTLSFRKCIGTRLVYGLMVCI